MNKYMLAAIEEAKKAAGKDEVPVGAVIVHGGKIISSAYNLRETTQVSTAHAEILAIEQACRVLGSWYLNGCDLYVTLEPCIMCAGAIINARIASLYFGAYDPKAGACGSVTDVFRIRELNHKVTVYGGIMESSCAALLTDFFRQKRNNP